MKLSITRGQKGFTLVELMVVVGILAVLMAIVIPAVTGTKSTSITGQVQSDADATQKAIDNFQNKGVSPSWPEQAFASSGSKVAYKLPSGTKLIKKDGISVITVAALAGGTANQLGTIENYQGVDEAAYLEMDWKATTQVWQSDGTINTARFVSDFLVKEPTSVRLDNDEGAQNSSASAELAEFLWLLKVNNPGSDEESRTLEVYRLTDLTSDVATYNQVF